MVAVAAIAAALAAPLAYSVQTAASAHTGSIPSAGPAVAGSGPGGGRAWAADLVGGGPGAGGFGGQDGRGQAAAVRRGGRGAGRHERGAGRHGHGTGRHGHGGGRLGGAVAALGGLLNAGTPSAELVALLHGRRRTPTPGWPPPSARTTPPASSSAPAYPVMAIGGFNGSDPSPTLAQFQQYVADGRIHYFIGGGGFGGMRPTAAASAAQEIATWVAGELRRPRRSADVTVYDLSGSQWAHRFGTRSAQGPSRSLRS